jgi:hypothetical protein
VTVGSSDCRFSHRFNPTFLNPPPSTAGRETGIARHGGTAHGATPSRAEPVDPEDRPGAVPVAGSWTLGPSDDAPGPAGPGMPRASAVLLESSVTPTRPGPFTGGIAGGTRAAVHCTRGTPGLACPDGLCPDGPIPPLPVVTPVAAVGSQTSESALLLLLG